MKCHIQYKLLQPHKWLFLLNIQVVEGQLSRLTSKGKKSSVEKVVKIQTVGPRPTRFLKYVVARSHVFNQKENLHKLERSLKSDCGHKIFQKLCVNVVLSVSFTYQKASEAVLDPSTTKTSHIAIFFKSTFPRNCQTQIVTRLTFTYSSTLIFTFKYLAQ